MKDECCGTCKHHNCNIHDDWFCTNPDSDFYTDYTDYEDKCEDYEERN